MTAHKVCGTTCNFKSDWFSRGKVGYGYTEKYLVYEGLTVASWQHRRTQIFNYEPVLHGDNNVND